jgi:hypothetical protein
MAEEMRGCVAGGNSVQRERFEMRRINHQEA